MSEDIEGFTLLAAIQQGIPLVKRPFAELGRPLGLAEEAVLAAAGDLFRRGIARRFGAVFDSRSLGYGSTLCAADVPAHDLERAASLLAPHPGVTHCYEREGRPNLWFTLTARSDRLRNELQSLAAALAPYPILNLPAIRRFKVEVVLDAPAREPPAAIRGTPSDPAASHAFTEREKSVVRKFQGNLPLAADLFDAVAAELAWDPEELLALLTAWKQQGILRRIGVILRHRNAGFIANGMCVWRVTPADVERAGQKLAAVPDVTHCYERPASAAFPYNLFAMVHARRRQAAQDLFRQLSELTGLDEGRILISTREFKKSSPVFFSEGDMEP